MAELVISTWGCDGNLRSRTLVDRMRKLEKGIALTQARTVEASSAGDGLVKGIFAAPEYLLSKRYGGFLSEGRPIPLTVEKLDHDQVVRDLKALSARYPRILVFPGTIAWQQPMTKALVDQHLKYYAQRIPVSGIPEATLNAAIKSEFEDADGYLVCRKQREAFLMHHGYSMPTRPIDDQRIKRMRERDPRFYLFMVSLATDATGGLPGVWGAAEAARTRVGKGATDVMFNTAHALLNGQVIGTYHKQGNFKEEKEVATTAFLPGAAKGVFDFEGYRCGLEICLDHNIGVMSQQLRRELLDIQVVLSDFVEWNTRNICVREGGFFVHASTKRSLTGVWQRSSNKMMEAPRIGSDTVAGFPLDHFAVEPKNRQDYSLAGTFMADLPGREPGKAPAKRWDPVQTPAKPFRSR